MKDEDKTKEQLISELIELRQQVADVQGHSRLLEAAETERLKTDEELWKHLVEFANDIIFRTDENGCLTFANPMGAKIMGYSKQELIGKHYLDFIRPDYRKEANRFFRSQLARKVSNTYREFPVVTRDGTELWLGQNVQLVMENDRFVGFQAVARDVTNRVLAEQALKQRNQELATLYESTTAISSDLSLDIVLQTVAQQMIRALDLSGCALSSWNREENLVETLVDYSVVDPDYTDPAGTIYDLADYPATRRVLETGHPTLIRRDDPQADEAELALMDEYRVLSWLMLPLIVRDQVVGLAELTDELKTRDFPPEEIRLAQSLIAQAAVAIENARLYEETQRRLREQMMLFDASQRLARAPLQAKEIAEIAVHQLAEVIGDVWVSFSIIDPQQGKLQVLADSWVDGQPDDRLEVGEAYVLTDYPVTAHVMETLQPLVVQADDTDADLAELANMQKYETATRAIIPLVVKGQVIGIVELDTQEKQYYTPEELNTAMTLANQVAVALDNARLYERVQRELTERMRAEEALRQYTAELEASNKELDAFAHTVAHDLKGPLGLIVGLAELLEEDYDQALDPDMCKRLHTISWNGRKMSSIIDGLLLLATVRKMEEVEMEPLDMDSIVAEAQGRLSHMVEEHQAEIILPSQKTWPMALGYGPWVEEVWVNYLSNALRYGGRPPRLELGSAVMSTPLAPQAGGRVRFWVHDNGPGMSLEDQARLFTPFTRLDRVRVKGHGLGLSIVRRIVERLGGEVGVESQVSVGSTFWFTLPAPTGSDDRPIQEEQT